MAAADDSGASGEAGGSVWAFRFFALHLWTVFGLFLSNALLLFAVGADFWRRRRRWRLPESWHSTPHVRLPFLLYVALLVLSTATSYEPRISLMETGEILTLAGLPLAFVLVRHRRQGRLIVDGINLMVALMSLYGLGQLLFGYGALEQRIRARFSHYMTFSGVLLIADLLLIAYLVSKPPRWRDWRWLALVAVNLALVASLTRGAWVALAITLVLLAVVRAPRSLFALVPAGALVVALAPEIVRSRVMSIGDLTNPSNYDRLCMAEAGLRMIAERPFLGHGSGMVAERYSIYRQPTATRAEVEHLHNTYLQLAAERGLLSLAAYLWLMGAALVVAYRGYRRARRRCDGDEDLYLGAFLALVAFNLAGLFEANWHDTEVQRLVLFLVALPFLLDRAPVPAAEADDRS